MTAAAAPAPEAEAGLEERKVVTVLFADLVASTELSARLDPEDLRNVLRPFFDAMVTEIVRFGGTVDKFAGDAVMAVFGAPRAHDDDPERAIRAGVAMQRRLERLRAEVTASLDVELEMRIGINTGEVIAGTGRPNEALVTGETVNIAARLETAARPGIVIVGERTYRDTREAFVYRPLGKLELKGVGRPLEAWEVIAEKEAPPRVLRAPLIGRTHELELLRQLLERAALERRAGLVTIIGPAGIGKTRLAQEFLSRISREVAELRVLRGRCLPYGEGVAMLPLADMLKGETGIRDNDPPAVIFEKAQARLRPYLADANGRLDVLLSSVGVRVAADPLGVVDTEAARELIVRAWRAFFEGMGAEGPVLAVIDDVHWANDTLLALLEAVLGRVEAPLLVLCTARPDFREAHPTWGSGLANAMSLSLSPLRTDESIALVQHLLGIGSAPHAALRAILERAEGNPFFTEELLRMLVEDGFLTREQTEWRLERDLPASLPDTVRSVIAARIDLLPANEKHAIQSASAIGRIFWEGAVERLEGNAVDAALEGLIAKRLVWEREHSALEGEREFSFNHVLTRDVAYASLSHARRTTAHGTAAAWIEEATQGRSEEFAEVLSHHYERAGEADRAARYALLAGQRLQHLFLAADAIRWYDRALETFSGTSDRVGEALQMETLSSRGAALEQLGSFADAEDAYTAALELAEHLGDGAAETGALAALAQVKRLQDKHDEARRVLDRALERARNVGERTLLSRLLYTAGTIAWGSGQWGAARRLHEEAREVAIAAADPVGEAFAEHGLAEVCFYAGPFEEGLEHAARCSTLAEERGQRPLLYENENQRGCLLWLLGRIEEARNVFDRSIEGAGEVGDRRNETFGLAEASLVLLSRGEFDAALDQACGSVERSMKLGAPRLELTCRACRIAVLAEFAALELMREDVAAALALSDRLGGSFSRARFIAARGWLELASGDDAAARVSFSEASLAADSKQEPLWCALIELRAWEHAGDSAAELDAAAGRLCEGDAEETVIFGSWGTYGLGLAAARRGEWDAALTVAKAAIARAEATFELPVVRRAAALAADALTALGEEQEAERYRLRSARGEPAATAKDDGVAAAATGLS